MTLNHVAKNMGGKAKEELNMSDEVLTDDASSIEEYDDNVPQWELHQAAVLALQAHEGQGFASVTAGDRDKTEVSWDFNPLVLPSYVNIEEHAE